MKRDLSKYLQEWPSPVIRDVDLTPLFSGESAARNLAITRASKRGWLMKLRRGVYWINLPYNQRSPDLFLLAGLIYGPSYVSFESALSFHGLIPEAVISIASATIKRKKEFSNPLGMFTYRHISPELFYLGVERIEGEDGAYFVASPWRALADLAYCRKNTWKDLDDLEQDLRIEPEDLLKHDLELLGGLAENYPSVKVRKCLNQLLKSVK
jgi:hypothetical protein